MSVKRVQLLASVSLFAVSAVAPAMAADMATKTYSKAPPIVIAAVTDWSGLYLGVNGGGGSSHNCFSVAGFLPDAGCHDATGGTIGGQIGYRWQLGSWVLGVEAQGNWADFSGSHDPLAGLWNAGRWTVASKTDSFGLFTGQIGHSLGSVLLYVKGGAAVVNNSIDVSRAKKTLAYPDGIALSLDDTRWGGTIGAGVEYALSPNWSIGVEYDHIFLGGKDYTVAAPWMDVVGHMSQDIDMGLVRLNYKFGGPVVARY
ncbi:MAG: outer membrane beta-barrel protein [Alphaproteobacteria bacterium]|nr:outer membrane beta-barrel protein [Alphaproteobacteria bacterium]